MHVYHGSDRKFGKLCIGKRYVRSEASALNEGQGIYFSTDKEVANTYGRYLYTLELNILRTLDFRDMSICRDFVLICFGM